MWAVDDTGFPKFGTASPGVARQYSGTLGKVANCQVGVSVHAVTDAASCPLNWRLFLPASWDDAEVTDEQAAAIRVRRARPASPTTCGTGPSGGWRWTCSPSWPAGDWSHPWWSPSPASGEVPPAGYGNTAAFRAGIAALGSHYVVQIENDLTAHPAEATAELKPCSGRGPHPKPRYRTKAIGLRAHTLAAGRDATVALTWPAGSRGPLTSRFLVIRVRPAGRRPTGRLAADGSLPAAWLPAEGPAEASEPTDY